MDLERDRPTPEKHFGDFLLVEHTKSIDCAGETEGDGEGRGGRAAENAKKNRRKKGGWTKGKEKRMTVSETEGAGTNGKH